MKFTMDTKLGDILEHPQAKDILEKYVPGLADNPMVGMLKGLTLKMVVANPMAAQMGLTEKKAEELLAEINKKIK